MNHKNYSALLVSLARLYIISILNFNNLSNNYFVGLAKSLPLGSSLFQILEEKLTIIISSFYKTKVADSVLV